MTHKNSNKFQISFIMSHDVGLDIWVQVFCYSIHGNINFIVYITYVEKFFIYCVLNKDLYSWIMNHKLRIITKIIRTKLGDGIDEWWYEFMTTKIKTFCVILTLMKPGGVPTMGHVRTRLVMALVEKEKKKTHKHFFHSTHF